MENKERNRAKKDTFSKVRRFIFTFILIVMLFIAMFFLSFEFKIIRKYYAGLVSDIVSDELNYALKIDEIDLNEVIQIRLKGVNLYKGNDSILSNGNLSIYIDLLKSNLKKIEIGEIVLDNSTINISRSKHDSLWNFEKIAKPSNTEKNKERTDLKININNLVFIKSNLSVNDELYSQKRSIFNPFRNNIQDLNAHLSANIDIFNNDYKLQVINFSLFDKLSKVRVINSFAKVGINSKGPFVDTLYLHTEGSNLIAKASVENLNVFEKIGNEEIKKMILNADITATNFDGEYIEYFTYLPTRFKKLDKIAIKARGSLDDLVIKTLKASKGSSKIDFSADIQDITDPENLHYVFNIKDSYLNRNDIKEFIPLIDLAEYIPNVNNAKISRIYGIGGTKSVESEIKISTDIGNIEGAGYLDFSNPKLNYKGEMNIVGLNLGAITKDTAYNSSLTGNLKVDGSGIMPKDFKGSYKLKLFDSEFFNKKLSYLNFDAKAVNKVIQLDTFNLLLYPDKKYNDLDEPTQPTIALKGSFDFNNNDLAYNFTTELQAINLKYLLSNNLAPVFTTGKLTVDGKGMKIDDIIGNIKSEFDLVIFNDRLFLPFEFNANLAKDSTYKKFKFNSSFFDAELTGEFSYIELITQVGDNVKLLKDFFTEKANIFLNEKQKITLDTNFQNKTKVFNNINCSIKADIKDLSPLSILLDGDKINSKGKFELDITSKFNESNINFKKIELNNIFFMNKDFELVGNSINSKAKFDLIFDGKERKFLDFDCYLKSEKLLQINDNRFDNPFVNINFLKDSIAFDTDFIVNKSNQLNIKSTLKLNNNSADLTINNLKYQFDTLFTIENSKPIKSIIEKDNITLRLAELRKDSTEIIRLIGEFEQNKSRFRNFNIVIEDVNIEKNLSKFQINAVNLNTLKGKVDKANINIDGYLDNPSIELSLNTKELKYTNQDLGKLLLSFKHEDSTITDGLITLTDNNPTYPNLEIKVFTLPLNLAFANIKERLHNAEKVNIVAQIKDMNLAAVGPFIPEVSNVKGKGDGKLSIIGPVDKVQYLGDVRIKDASLLTNASNIFYNIKGNVLFNNDSLKFNNLAVENTKYDNPNGRATLNGFMKLDKFNFTNFDFLLETKDFTILTDESKKSMPNLFGKFRIATDKQPLHFFGTFDKPNLGGSVNILEADIQMPQPDLAQNVSPNFIYHREGDKVFIKLDDKKTIDDNKKSKEFQANTSFNDLMKYDVDVRFGGNNIKIQMGLPAFITITSYVGYDDKTKSFRYEKERYKKEMLFNGSIQVFPKSTMQLLGKKFNLSGTLKFPTGSIENPTLDMNAFYSGRTKIDNIDKEYTVNIKMTGTKQKPDLLFSYKIGQEEVIGDKTTIERDVFYLFTFGKTFNEMNKSSNVAGGGLFDETLNRGTSAILSSSLNEVMSNLGGVIKSANIDYLGTLENSRIRLQGDIVGGLEWSVGGNLNNISNPEVNIDLPATVIFNDNSFWQNFLAQLRYINNLNQTQTQDQIRWEFRLKYGSSW